MAEVNSFFSSATPRLLSVLRIVSAFFFMLHGAQKLFGFLAPPGAQGPPLFSQVGIGGILEFFGGLLLLVGLFTRPVAFILSGLMAAAYFIGHATQGFWPALNQGEAAIMFCFVFFYLVFAGPGAWSLDSLLRGRRNSAAPAHA